MSETTALVFVSHASVLLRHGESFLLTDPWYCSVAFTSWRVCPPPALNPEMLLALARSGKLAITLSHAHPDHTDAGFLKRLPPGTPIFVPAYADNHFTDILEGLGLSEVVELDTAREFGSFRLTAFPHHYSPTDAAVAIETPDAFVFHGNDAWALSSATRGALTRMKPAGKPSLFMGQGGSASGHPLTYFTWPPAERQEILRKKNAGMLRSIANTARECGFERALAYACFTRIEVDGHDYGHDVPVQTGSYANTVVDTDIFIDLSPGDVYLPAEDRVIAILSSLQWRRDAFETEPPRRFPRVGKNAWTEKYSGPMREFSDAMARHLAGLGEISDLDVELLIEVRDRDHVLDTYRITGRPSPTRRKLCRVESGIMAAVLSGDIPFEDLYTGYLAEWDRVPADKYNLDLVHEMIAFGYEFQHQVTCAN